MKYKVTLNGKTYEVEVDETSAMLVDEYEALAPAPAAAPAPQHCSFGTRTGRWKTIPSP